jgi:hypothetical protein
MTQATITDNKEYFEFLNQLRRSGQINMFGAGPVLEEVYDLKRHEARAIVVEWMKQYKGE